MRSAQFPIQLDTPNTLLVTCAKGLSDYLASEIKALGFTIDDQHETGVVITGSLRDAMTLNLRLRTAFNVQYLLKAFECRSPDRLYNRVQTIPWEDLISPDSYLTVTSRAETRAVKNSMFASVRVKDAIVDRVKEHCGRRPNSGPDRTGMVIALYWKENRAWLYLNTSGQKLADRGYRRLPHDAPMQETLAAAVVMATGYDGSQPLVCPMCGSGTLAIEAALIAQNRAPGLLRTKFGLLHLMGIDLDAWEAERRAARKLAAKKKPPPIIATDIDPRAVTAARKNALTAGVDHLIEFAICDFAKSPVPENPNDNGIVLLNPEYGKRMGETTELAETYVRIGDFFKQRCPGYTGYVFTGNPDLAKRVGLKASRRMPFWNAEIECRLSKYELYAGSRRQPTG
jgi:putative N6-adenine-specific DNA methylase